MAKIIIEYADETYPVAEVECSNFMMLSKFYETIREDVIPILTVTAISTHGTLVAKFDQSTSYMTPEAPFVVRFGSDADRRFILDRPYYDLTSACMAYTAPPSAVLDLSPTYKSLYAHGRGVIQYDDIHEVETTEPEPDTESVESVQPQEVPEGMVQLICIQGQTDCTPGFRRLICFNPSQVSVVEEDGAEGCLIHLLLGRFHIDLPYIEMLELIRDHRD